MQLIKTKLRPPSRAAGLIRRERLDMFAARIRNRRLVFVKAAAGYGKSSLLHSWYSSLSDDRQIVGWLSLDRSIDDLRTFFFYVISSLREATPDFGSEFVSFIESSRDPRVSRVVAAFVSDLLATDQQVFLFIDDIHLLTDAKSKKSVEAVLSDAPANFHLIMASRHAPPFSTARLRMLGEVEELGEEQLKFNTDEIGEFVRLSRHEPLSAEMAKNLMVATEGWAAGIQLAMISLAQHANAQDFLDRYSGENKAVSEYLADDLIASLPESIVTFLLKTSILEFFNDDLCNVVAGISDAGAQIRNLVAQSLFIFSLDDEQKWYRYHHLFSELLQRVLKDRLPDIISELHKRASAWYARHNYVELAFSHAKKAEDWIGAARILDTSCVDLFYAGKLSSLMRWSDQIPPDVRSQFPRLQLEIAWSIILEWRFDDARKIIMDVETLLVQWRSQRQRLEYLDSVSRIVLHRKMMLALFMDDMPLCEKYVLELLHDFPSEDPYLRGTLENCLIHSRREMFRLDNVDKMDRWARHFFEKSGSKFVLVWHESILGPTYHLRGDTELAETALLSAMEIAEYVDGPDTPLQAMPAMLLAEIKYEKNEIQPSEGLIDRFQRQAEKQGFVDHLAAYYVTRARLLHRNGDLKEAKRVIAEGKAAAEFRGFRRLASRLDYESVRLADRTGDLSVLRAIAARGDVAEEKQRLMPGQHSMGYDEQFVLSWQLACRQLGRAREAIDVLKSWTAFAADRGALRSEVRFLIALSQCLAVAGEEGEALRKLRAAVQKAARPRYLRSFIDGGELTLMLLRKLFAEGAERTGTVSEFGLELIEAFAGEPPGLLVVGTTDGGSIAPEPELAPPESLNERERDILRLVAWGLSNKEIACKLGMTEGTVKWYLQQIFSKMDVRRRSMAVRRARQFGLL